MRPNDLHALVLAHLQRFFSAARRATDDLRDDELASLISLGGTLLWANSPFMGGEKDAERALALAGGLGSMAGNVDLGGSGPRTHALAVLDDLETELLTALDPLLDALAHQATDAGLDDASPSKLDDWLWHRLFPDYPWPCGQATLEASIRLRMG